MKTNYHHKLKHKKKMVQLQRLLLEPIPQTPVPAPYFSIPSPDPYRFPLGQTMLEGIKLLQNYFPQDINDLIKKKIGQGNVERMTRYKDAYCMMGKGGNGLIIGETFLPLKQITSYAFGPHYILIAFQDLRLEVYSLDLKLIKTFKKFSTQKITFLKLLNVPNGYQGVIFLSHSQGSVSIHRLQKSFLSKLSQKLNKNIISKLKFPVTQMLQIPSMFRKYIKKDQDYKDCSLVCISAVNEIYLIRINHFRLDFDEFWKIVYHKRVQQLGANCISWGQTNIDAPSRQLKGQKLVLVCSFSNKIYFFSFKQVQQLNPQTQQTIIKYEWIESFPFTLKDQVAFCQYIKKNQIILITQMNSVMIFNTKNFDIFEKSINSESFQIFTEQFNKQLQMRIVKTIEISNPKQEMKKIQLQIPQLVLTMKQSKKYGRRQSARDSFQNSDSISKSQEQTVSEMTQEVNMSSITTKKNIVTYADTFCYEYPTVEIYYLTKKQFGVYVYCNWKLISDLLRLQKKHQECMLFLIAIKKKANKFDLGIEGQQIQINQYIHEVAIQFINKKVSKLKFQKEIFQNLQNVLLFQDHFKTFIKPIEFLTETQQFTFLFNTIADKLQKCLLNQNFPYEPQAIKCEKVYYAALMKFIEHGRIKYIPESHLQTVLDYFQKIDRLDIIDRLAIYFDLQKIDKGVLVQCLLKNDLTVSLAHICIQGNQGLFVTPFVKFWGVSANFKHKNQIQKAAVYAFRSLWYVKLCLQRNWALKQYSFQRYAKMISILSHHFLTQPILIALLEIRPQDCLQTLSYYFAIQNSMIVNQEMSLMLKKDKVCSWIDPKPQNMKLQMLLSSICDIVTKAIPSKSESKKTINIFLSSIMIYRTIKFSDQKYLQIIIDLIQNYKGIKDIKYGLEDKLLQEFKQNYYDLSDEEIDQVLASRYIIRILTLVFYDKKDFIKSNLMTIYEKSRQYNLIDLQSEISFMNGQFITAIEIYLRSRPSLKILIFQFLQNSFKRLILEKRKNDKKRLGDCLTQKVKAMVQLNPNKTKQLVDNYLPQVQEQLIDALADDEQLQLQYLEEIIKGENKKQAKKSLSQKSILKFVQLMAKSRPEQLLQAFRTHSHYPINQCVKICQKYQVYDSLQYLLEKGGSMIEAVKISILRIDKILQSRNQFDSEQNLAPYIKIKQILDHSIQICRKHSVGMRLQDNEEQIWQALLDSSIALYNKYVRLDFPEDQIQIFFFINGEIMENLASNCSIQHTVDLLQNKYQNLNMGGKMSKAFITILTNLAHSINMMYVAQSMIKQTYQDFLVMDYESKLSGIGGHEICETCQFGIAKRQKSKHFKCHHSYHNECVIQQNPLACVYCLANRFDQYEYHINSISSPLHPKVTKINEIFGRFKAKKNEMVQIIQKQQIQQMNKQSDNVVISNLQKKKNKLQMFDDNQAEQQVGFRRVLRQLKMI